MVSIDSILGQQILAHPEFRERVSSKDPSEQLQQFQHSITTLEHLFNTNEIPWILANGGAVHYYARSIGVNRLPTDVDIVTPFTDMETVQRLLMESSITAQYHQQPVLKHGLVYFDPQVKATIGNSEVDVLRTSRIIHTPSQIAFQPDFTSEIFQKHIRTLVDKEQTPPLAPLEFIFLAKVFQMRETPKQDFNDLYLIKRIIQNDPSLFDIGLYNYFLDNWIKAA